MISGQVLKLIRDHFDRPSNVQLCMEKRDLSYCCN